MLFDCILGRGTFKLKIEKLHVINKKLTLTLFKSSEKCVSFKVDCTFQLTLLKKDEDPNLGLPCENFLLGFEMWDGR